MMSIPYRHPTQPQHPQAQTTLSPLLPPPPLTPHPHPLTLRKLALLVASAVSNTVPSANTTRMSYSSSSSSSSSSSREKSKVDSEEHQQHLKHHF